MYSVRNYGTKKELVEAFNRGEEITVYQPGPFGGREPKSGEVVIEGPHGYHKFYVRVRVDRNVVVKVLK